MAQHPWGAAGPTGLDFSLGKAAVPRMSRLAQEFVAPVADGESHADPVEEPRLPQEHREVGFSGTGPTEGQVVFVPKARLPFGRRFSDLCAVTRGTVPSGGRRKFGKLWL